MKTLPLMLLFIGGLSLTLVSPPSVRVYRYAGGRLVEAAPEGGTIRQPVLSADFDGDGYSDSISLRDGAVEVLSLDKILYHSDPAWEVEKAEFADLNRDGRVEVVLLVWRDFAPWPIDRLLPVGGRISEHHNAGGRSCHLILIAWRDVKAAEAWAGSALAQPVIDFTAADLDGDGRVELVTLDGDYTDPPGSPAKTVRIWEWNGFGFSRLEQIYQAARQIFVTVNGADEYGILVSSR